jgi:hypothetical protein
VAVWLAYAVALDDAGLLSTSALKRPPVRFRIGEPPATCCELAIELGCKDPLKDSDALSQDQAKWLKETVAALSEEERETYRAYARAALLAIVGNRGAPDEALSTVPLGSTRTAGSPHWILPGLDLLDAPSAEDVLAEQEIRAKEQQLQAFLNSVRNIHAEVKREYTSVGPRVLRLGIQPTGIEKRLPNGAPARDAAGQIIYEQRTRVAQIMALKNDIQAVLQADDLRMQAPVPGRGFIGVEIPNPVPARVLLRDILESKEHQAARASSKLTIAVGRDVAGKVRLGDLARMPHLLIAGSTGSGKSVMLNAIITTFLMQATPEEVRLLLVDPKMVELVMYNGIPHLLMPVVTEVDKVVGLLKNAITEMERRYRLFSQLGVRNLDGYRKLRSEKQAKGDLSLENLPAIVIIIDELADLMMAAPEEVEGMICRLAQLARATGIHLIVATQRPSVDVITGLIKANIPARIAFMVASAVDSRTILDTGGAEHLLGRGDMLYLPGDAGKPVRVQGAFVSDEDTERLVAYWQAVAQQSGESQQRDAHAAWPTDTEEYEDLEEESVEDSDPEEEGDATTDEDSDELLLQRIIELLQAEGLPTLSVNQLQKLYRIGNSRAARLMDLLEERRIVGPKGSAPRGGRSVLQYAAATSDQPEQEQERLTS